MSNSSFFGGSGSTSTTVASIQSKIDEANTAKVGAETAKAGAETAKAGAEAAQNASESARDASLAARDASQSARDTAATHKTAAEGFKTDAEGFKTSAEASATNASTSATTSTTAALDAEKLALQAEDSQFTLSDNTTGYSALHYKEKASDSATAAAGSATTSAGHVTTASGHATTATTKAGEAATSASDALTAKNDAVTAKNDAVTAKNDAVTAKNDAVTAKNDAVTAKNEATTQANTATTQANTATTQAGVATTQAGNSATSATAASNSASSAATAQTAAEAARDSALSALDNFQDQYLGSFSTAPTTDGDGDALVAGALYFNETDDAIKVYSGSQWLNAYASLSGALIANQNLSDLNNAAIARTNLGLAAVASSGNLTDLGITDGTNGQALKTDGNGNFSFGDVATSTAWADITSKPTTLAGFGISNAAGNLSFGDNDKATFGAGNDLEIYHDGSNSWVHDRGTGNLNIEGRNVFIVGANNDTILAGFIDGAESRLYYNGSQKLATTSTGIDVTGNATFGDNGKAIFGAGSDLQIRHDGNNSKITHTGTGGLYIGADTFALQNGTHDENLMVMADNGAVTLYHDNSAKLATTSTGIDVTGTVVSDGLTVDGNVDISSSNALLYFMESDTTDKNSLLQSNAGLFRIQTVNDAKNTFTQRFRIDHATGDISFFEDTGTTAKLFWDASAESLGIGTDSPDKALTISASDSQVRLYDADGTNQFASLQSDNGTAKITSRNNTSHGTIAFQRYNGTTVAESMRIDSSGNVIIGASSAVGDLHVQRSGGSELWLGRTTNSGQTTALLGEITFGDTVFDSNMGGIKSNLDGNTTSSNLSFYTQTTSAAATERMRIDSSGRVGIGDSNPDGLLHLTGDTNSNGAELYLQVNNNNTTDNLGAIHFGNNVDSTLSKILSGTSGANNSSYLTFSTSNAGTQTEHMRIDSLGNLLVGAQSYNNDNAGIGLGSSNFFYATRSGNLVGSFNRLSSDGDILDFRKDSTTIGSIEAHGGKLQIGQGNANVQFSNADDAIIPTNGNGTVNDNAVSLGTASARYKDLYAGGSIFATGTDYQIMVRQGSNQPWYLRSKSDGTFGVHLNGTGDIATFDATGIKISSSHYVWHGGNDGAGSGLDADLLDGIQGSSYLRSDITDVMSGQLNIENHIDMSYNNSTAGRFLKLPRSGGITFYGDGSDHHAIMSRNAGNSADDDILISSYGGVHIDLDSNNNNSGGADFTIGRHNSSTAYLTFSGENYNLTVSGNVTAFSDERLKDDIETLDGSKVYEMRGVSFTKDGRAGSGVIAQELQKIAPELVEKDGEYLSVAYGNVVGYLIEAVKELKAEIEELKKG